MQRYFLEKLNADNKIDITGDDFFHMVKVMRNQVGDQFYCVVNGKTALAEIEFISDKSIVAKLIEWLVENKELPVQVTIACGLPKGDKLDWIVQKGTELGAHEFVPFATKRSVVKWDRQKAAKKMERLGKIAKEAAEQSHRTLIPHVAGVMNLQELTQYAQDFDIRLVAYEESARVGESTAFATSLKSIQPNQKMLLVFGSEGGLTNEEVEFLLHGGFQSCGLGPRILRAETAPLYALSVVSYTLELLSL